MKQSRWQSFIHLLWRVAFRSRNLLWLLPVPITRERKHSLIWRTEYAAETMRRVLDDLETRGDEVSARARLYTALTTVNWS